MARPADPLQAPAIAEITKHLKVGADTALVRSKFAQVPRQTWERWVKLAIQRFLEAGGEITPHTSPAAPVAPARPQSGKAAKRLHEKPPKAPATPPRTGDLMPAPPGKRKGKGNNAASADGASNPNMAGKISEDGSTYTIMTMFGPQESTIIRRFTEPPEIDPHEALAIVDRLGEQYLNAGALMEASIKRVGDGHIVLNSKAYAAAVELQQKILVNLHTIIKDSRNLDSVRRFMVLVSQALKHEDPAFARRVIDLLRSAATNLTRVTTSP